MFYVDRFKWEIVKEKDEFAAPERYYEYRKGDEEGIIKETYIASYNPFKLIDFVYCVDDDKESIATKRDNLFKENNMSTKSILYAYTVPPEWYDRETAGL